MHSFPKRSYQDGKGNDTDKYDRPTVKDSARKTVTRQMASKRRAPNVHNSTADEATEATVVSMLSALWWLFIILN